MPARLDEGRSNHFFHQTPKDHFRQIYYETIDNTTNCIANRFDQSGYKIYCNLEQLLIKASNQSDFEDELKIVCDFYKDDFNSDNLKAQLVTFGVEFQQKNVRSTGATSFFDLLDHFKAYSIAQRSLFMRVVQLILVMPATNATSERSFSALRRIKDYLRATMKQERLNHLLVLHVQKELTDSFDLKDIASDFISGSQNQCFWIIYIAISYIIFLQSILFLMFTQLIKGVLQYCIRLVKWVWSFLAFASIYCFRRACVTKESGAWLHVLPITSLSLHNGQ